MCFQFANFLVMIERIYILCLIIIIKSEVWTISHCLGLGHETMVCAVCLLVFLYISFDANILLNATRLIITVCAIIADKQLLAATKQLYEWYFLSVCLSVCLSVGRSVGRSVCPSHLFDYVPFIVSSWHFQELSPRIRVTSMQKVKVRGQRSRSQRSQPNLAVSGL